MFHVYYVWWGIAQSHDNFTEMTKNSTNWTELQDYAIRTVSEE